MYCLVTVDPGKNGAIIYWTSNKEPDRVIQLRDYSVSVWGALPEGLKNEMRHADVALVERARAWSTDGAMGAFSYGYCFALLLSAIRDRAHTCSLIEPKVWQSVLRPYVCMQPPVGVKQSKYYSYLFATQLYGDWLKDNLYTEADKRRNSAQLIKKYDGVYDALAMGAHYFATEGL